MITRKIFRKNFKQNFRRNLRGISTIIATIIIVAIAITMAIAAAYWAMGIGNSFTKFEKLEFMYVYSDAPVAKTTYTDYQYSGNGTFNQVIRVNLQFRNTGSAALTIQTLTLNGKAAGTGTGAYQYVDAHNLIGTILQPGNSTTAVLYLPYTSFQPGNPTAYLSQDWHTGDSVEIELGTVAGRSYYTTVVL